MSVNITYAISTRIHDFIDLFQAAFGTYVPRLTSGYYSQCAANLCLKYYVLLIDIPSTAQSQFAPQRCSV